MTQVVETVGTVMSAVEPNGSFCVEIGTGSFAADPVVEGGALVLNRPLETPGTLQHRVDGYPVKVTLPKSAQYEATLNLQALAARASGLAVETRLGKYIGVVMGGTYVGTGTTVNDAGATTTVIILTSATNFREGGVAVFATGTGGTLEARVIKTISANTITLKHALTNAPANASTVYAGVTYYMDNEVGSDVTSLQMMVQGLGGEDRWLLKGGQCLGGFSLELPVGGIPRAKFPWTFADFDPADGTNTTMNLYAAALADASFSSVGIHSIMDSELRIEASGGSTPALVHAAEFSFTPSIAYGPHKTPAGTNTVYQWVRMRSAPVMSGSFDVPFESFADYDLDELFETGDYVEYDLQLQIGTVGGGILIDVPHMRVDSDQRIDMGGIAGRRVSWHAREDTRTTTNSTNIQKSAFRIHFF